ncbi:MAG: NAD-binding protein [Pseudonocardia sp.]
MQDHAVVVGYGTKGAAAVATMLGDGVEPGTVVVVDIDPERLRLADSRGLVTVGGSGTRSEVLRLAGVDRAGDRLLYVKKVTAPDEFGANTY